jgi:hypothetical protein
MLAAGIVACSALMAEGAADNRGSVLAATAGHASPAAVVLAPAAANCDMMTGRLGDAVIRRLGPRAVLLAGTLAAAAG